MARLVIWSYLFYLLEGIMQFRRDIIFFLFQKNYPQCLYEGQQSSNSQFKKMFEKKVLLCLLLVFTTYQQCLSHYEYLDFNTGQCLPCGASCLTCFDTVICTQCISEYYLSNNQCLKCSYGCAVCSSGSVCSTCNDGLYLTSAGTCLACNTGVATCTIATVQTCQNNYFMLGTICAGCLTNCKVCADFVTCTTCALGYYLDASGAACLACPANCRICTSAGNCFQCSSGYTPNGSGCSLYNCSTIDPFCISCANGLCLSCQTGKYLFNGVCLQGASLLCLESTGPYYTDCVTSSYGCQSYSNIQSQNGNQMSVCLPVTATKSTEYAYLVPAYTCSGSCTTPNTVTISYKTSQTYYQLTYHMRIRFYSSTTTRSLTVKLVDGSGQVLTSHNSAVDISQELSTYSQIDTACLSCLYGEKIVSGVLVYSAGEYSTNLTVTDTAGMLQVQEVIVEHGICQVDHCSSCLSAVDCSACLSPYYLQLTTCVSACDSGFYLYGKTCYLSCPSGTYTLTSSYTCQTCVSPCLTCSSSSACITCLPSYFLQGTSCLTTCSNLSLFPNSTSQVCQTCPNPCVTCSITNTTLSCLSCSQGYLFSNGSCIYLCPTGHYGSYLNSTSQCLSCSSACSNCYLNSTTCSSCNTGYLLVGTTCQLMVSCPAGYYIDTALNRCLSCHYPCATCSGSESNCTSCSKGVLSGNVCLNGCPTGQYPDYTNSTNVSCVACVSPCASCVSAVICISCINGSFLSSGVCGSNCPSGTYANSANHTCSTCVPPCQTCTTASACLTCSSGYLDGSTCTLTCNSTSYISSSFVCTLCPSPCTSCRSSTLCLTCTLPHILFNASCITVAVCNNQTGYYPAYSPNASSATQGVCSACTFPCLGCQNNSVSCTSCANSYFFVVDTSRCLSQCPNGYYTNGTNCLKCDPNCYLCSVTSTNCTSCSSGMYLSSSTCTSTCPSTFYPDDQTQSCLTCVSPCQTCYSLYLCLTCATGILYNKGCVSSCPASTYLNSSSNSCVGCTNSCLTCSGTSSSCLSCSNGYYLSNSSCGTTCPSGFYPNDYTNTCDQCVSPCLACSSASACTSCVSSYFFLNSQCLTSCPSSYYPSSSTSQCLTCNLTLCLTCSTGANACLTCSTNFFMHNNTCGSSCPSGYYPNSVKATCDTCPFPCATCTNYTFCGSCLTGYYLFSDRCFSACPVGYLPDSASLCQICGTNCLSCISSTNCSQCQTNYFLLNNSCVSTCPTGMFAGSQAITNYDQCQNCQTDCINCSAYDFCLTCQSNLIQFNGLCLSSCPIFYFPASNGTCQQCSTYCTTCTNSTHCTACIGTFLHNNACTTSCPNGTYPLQGTSCSPCLSPCLECTGDYTCTSCLTGYIYFHSYCVVTCPSDVWYYPHNHSCSATCPNPYNKLASNLTCYTGICGKSMVSLNGYCLSECSTGYYVNMNQECVLCELGGGICGSLFRGDLQVVYSQALTLVLYMNQEAEVASIGDVAVSFVDVDGVTVSRSIQSYTITPFKMEFVFDRSAVSLVNITLTIPYLASKTSNQRISSNSFKTQLPSYQDYSQHSALSFLSLIPLFLTIILLGLIVVNVINKSSRFVQVLDYVQLVAVTLYLDIQYPPVLEEFLAGWKAVLFAGKNLVDSTPYSFSPPKFIFYHIDASLFRTQLFLFLFFILTLLTFVILIAIHTYNTQKLRKVVKLIRYRLINDLFSICMTPLFLFACQFNSQPSMLLAISVFLLLLGICYVAWISYKIIQVKKLSELSGLLGDFQRTESKIGLMYIPFAFIRRIIFTIGLGIAPYEPIATITLLLVLTFLIMVCIYFYQPFDNQYTDYVTIFMQSSLTLYVVCLIVLGLGVMSPGNSHNMGIFCMVLILITVLICLGWLTYLTVNDIRTKGCCPELKEEDRDGKDDYSEKKYDQDQDQIRKMEGLQPLHKNKEEEAKQGMEKDSATSLLNRFGSGGLSEQLFSQKNVQNDQFRHWSQEQSSNTGEANANANVRESKLPHLMIKVERNQKQEQPQSQMAIN